MRIKVNNLECKYQLEKYCKNKKCKDTVCPYNHKPKCEHFCGKKPSSR